MPLPLHDVPLQELAAELSRRADVREARQGSQELRAAAAIVYSVTDQPCPARASWLLDFVGGRAFADAVVKLRAWVS